MLADALARAALVCGVAKPTIALLTAVTTAIFSSVILYLHARVLREEKWAQYLGWAFGFFTLQYLLQVGDLGWLPGGLLLPTQQVAQALCSPANNLCILAAARVLLRRTKTLPLSLVIIAFLTSTLGLGQDGVWIRMPDALLSFYCLSLLGWAIFRNLPKRRPYLATFNGILPVLYGCLNIVFALNPLLAAGAWPELSVGLAVVEDIEPLVSLDALVFAIAFVFKVGLFLGALLLIIKSLTVLSPEQARGLLDSIAHGRGRYLRPQGILRALGESAEADLVALCMRVTGAGGENVVWMRWIRTPAPGMRRSSSISESLRSADRSIVAWIFRAGLREVTFPDLERDWERASWYSFLGLGLTRAELARNREIKRRYWPFVPGMRSFVAVPIYYHGAVIACLNVEWKEANGFSATTIQRIHQMAALLAPTVYTRRQVVSIDALVTRLRSAKTPDDAPATALLEGLVGEIHDVLSPFAVICLIDLGFRSYAISRHDQRSGSDVGTDDDLRSLRERIRSRAGGPSFEPRAFYLAKLVGQGQDLEIGKLALVVNRRYDPRSRPSLATGKLHRRIVAELVTEAVLGVIRTELSGILNRLQDGLNLSALSTAQAWFREIEKAIAEAGLAWAVATGLPSALEKDSVGHAERLALVARQAPSGEVMQHVPLAAPAGGACHLLRLRLENTGAAVWVAVGRRSFGRELQSTSPWKDFLLRMAQIADSALVRIERQRLQLKAKGFEGVATRVETAGLLMHTLGNDANALLQGMQYLEYVMPEEGAPVTSTLRTKIRGLKTSAERFGRIAHAFKHRVPSDERSEIPLVDAWEQIDLLHGESLGAMGIEVTTDLAADLIIAVPLDAAYIALVTVVLNAAEAIHRNGSIAIRASASDSDDGKVVCLVTDSGPGIREDLSTRIFDPDFSTKPDGTGVGLGLARDSLRRNGGNLVLKSGKPGATTFALYFPRPRREAV